MIAEAGARQIHPLTSLRFVAALLVFVHHSVSSIELNTLRSFGAIGVGFFFMLSGLILSHVYHRRLELDGRRNFYAGRIARIFPLHLVTAAMALAIFLPSPDIKTLIQLALNLPLLQAWAPIKVLYFSINLPSWSLSAEMFFYALFPFLLPTVLRTGKITAAIALALICTANFGWAGLWDGVRVGEFDLEHWAIYIFPLARLADFLGGILLWRLVYDARLSVTLATILEVLAVAAVVGVAANYSLFPISQQYSAAFFPACVLFLGVFYLSAGGLSVVLSLRPFTYLGEISFAFYLVHLLVIRSLPEMKIAGWLAVTLVASVALHHGVELPAQRRLVRYLGADSR